ncbi:rCG26543, isoform CRA_c [Rattus norvegicus]|uniref:RCG26543, isoform CRA_c n=1 Tax=Rattus norvegicus TaxID=10116 RepID=A6HPB1_RAT|nr:rCG26543, isoform CRA_c [Rattus norvegicus]
MLLRVGTGPHRLPVLLFYENRSPGFSLLACLPAFFFFWFSETGFLCVALLSWTSLCRPGWP